MQSGSDTGFYPATIESPKSNVGERGVLAYDSIAGALPSGPTRSSTTSWPGVCTPFGVRSTAPGGNGLNPGLLRATVMTSPSDPGTVDPATVGRVVERHPVRVAVLYGSRVRGTAGMDSDVDVAVAFEEHLSSAERLQARIDLVVDLVEALGMDDVDVADLDVIRPEVGLAALERGEVLLGDEEADAYHDRFQEVADRDHGTHEERMRQFDAVIERLKSRL